MGTVILRNIPVRFIRTDVRGIWIADHADDVNCDAIGIGQSRLAAARSFFDDFGG